MPRDSGGSTSRTSPRAAASISSCCEPKDIVGEDTLARLLHGELAHMRAANEDWLLKRVAGRWPCARVSLLPRQTRSAARWTGRSRSCSTRPSLLVIMAWLWPLTRDLRQLERSTTRFGDRAWQFDARMGLRSPVYSLAEAFRRMAARIDSLIGAQKDMTNAMSHEIKTPLARMRFEIEMARTAGGLREAGHAPEPSRQGRRRARRLHHGDARLRDSGARRSGAERQRARSHADPARCRRDVQALSARRADHPLRGFTRGDARAMRRSPDGNRAQESALQRGSLRAAGDSGDVQHPARRGSIA